MRQRDLQRTRRTARLALLALGAAFLADYQGGQEPASLGRAHRSSVSLRKISLGLLLLASCGGRPAAVRNQPAIPPRQPRRS